MATTALFDTHPAAPSLRERRDAVAAAIEALDGWAGSLPEAGSAELEELVSLTDALATKAAAARFSAVAEAHSRGLVAESDAASLTAWVTQRASTMRQHGGGGIARAVQHLGLPANALVREAVESGRITVPVANVVIGEIARIESRLADGARDAVLEAMVTMGEEHGASGVRVVLPELLARYGASDELEREEARLRRGRALSRPFVDDGLHEYRLLLDPEGAAVLESAVEALSAPAPCEDPETGLRERDLRTSDQRRADALLEIVRAGVATMDTKAGRGAKATVLVSMSLEDLRAGTLGGRVSGGLDAGALLAPETVRRMACDAELVPAVLGTDGELLDLGRAKRLFSPGQTRALWLRDGGCTYPGCTTPARWADAHHLVHWTDGGRSDLGNAALLCGRHHTIVHSRRLAGRLAATGPAGAGSGLDGAAPGPDVVADHDVGQPGASRGSPQVVWDTSPGSYDRVLERWREAG